jgi:fructokinase
MRIGVDLGGTKIEALAMDADGRELQRIRVPTPKGDYDGTVAAIAGLVSRLEAAEAQVGTVGVGIPGTVVKRPGQRNGLVKNANSTWLNGRPLEADLSAEMAREVRCANDANCFAISEATDGAARGYGVVFGVILGTGCGGGVAVEGAIASGPNGLRGEWGHTPLPWPDAEEWPGPECYCGRRGCLEKWISGTGFEDDYERATGIPKRGPEIVALAQCGDVQSMAAMARYEDRLARGLSTLVNVLDPDAIVLGGGMSQVDMLYTGGVRSLLSQYAFGGGADTPILRNVHGDSSGVRGAAWLWPQRS